MTKPTSEELNKEAYRAANLTLNVKSPHKKTGDSNLRKYRTELT
ncbi:MAG: hypothetical protein WC203_06000 [Candidatus Bathyarchaeia archaeon]